MPGIINYRRVLSHSILVSTYTQIISEPIVQNILYLQYIANNLSNAFTHQKCHQIIFLQAKCQKEVKCHLTPIRGGEVCPQASNTAYYNHPRE